MATAKGRGGARGSGRDPDDHGRRPPRNDAGEAIRQFVVEAVADKVSAGLRAKAAEVEEKAARHQAGARRFGPQIDDVLDLWTRRPPGARRARLSLDEIARAAVDIADTEGFDALSMRRLAIALDAGTMTLYHYVRTKDELLALVSDAIMAELLLDEHELSGGWRTAMTNIARHSLATFRRHPWVFDVRDDPPIGPNGVRHFDQSWRALASLEIPLQDKIDIISVVDEYVFGYGMQMRNNYGEP